MLCIVGQTGSGKSTLLLGILGEIRGHKRCEFDFGSPEWFHLAGNPNYDLEVCIIVTHFNFSILLTIQAASLSPCLPMSPTVALVVAITQEAVRCS